MASPWPNDKRVAVCLSWDVDGEAAQYVRHPERARAQLSELMQRLYGPQIGIWKVLDLLERHAVPATFYVPAYTAHQHPDVLAAIDRAGHPIGLHGYLHRSLDTMTPDEEEEDMTRAQAVLSDLLGRRPTLYRAPSWELNRTTPELLVRHGIRSDSSLMDDERPYVLDTPAGGLVEIPIHWLLDDAEHWNHSRANRDKAIADPDSVVRIWQTEFDGFYASGGCFVLTLHPFISGRFSHMSAVERLVRYILGHPGVWWTTLEEVTRWAEGRDDIAHRALPPPEPVP